MGLDDGGLLLEHDLFVNLGVVLVPIHSVQYYFVQGIWRVLIKRIRQFNG